MDTLQLKVIKRHVSLMKNTMEILTHILRNTTQEQATTLRDGVEGWTILEIVCHLRDFDGFFLGRAKMMLEQDVPTLPAYDHEAIAIEQNYNSQDLAYVHDQLTTSRKTFVEFFKSLNEEDWTRTGIHPESGEINLLDSLMQVGHHDIDHIEQITRLLEREVPGSGSLPSEGDGSLL